MSHEHEQPACIADAMLSDAQLLAALDGEADAAVLLHLHACPCCAARAELLSRLDHGLRGRLARSLCPNTLTLIDHYLRLLDPDQHTAVATHLQGCQDCTNDLTRIVVVTPLAYRFASTA